MQTTIKPALILLLCFTALTGIAYPLAVTLIAQSVFSNQANGSLLGSNEQPLGSELIGQPFTQPQYFWGRPSATSPAAYNGAASSGSNQGPTNPALLDAVQARVKTLYDADPGHSEAVPVDLVTASASGLDPDISPGAAAYQISRVARARQMSPDSVRALVERYTEARQWGVLGEARVNVLKLNLALDQRLK
ncbi:potassium-transporting ATPase subunit KdpC [Candidatus Methylobacter oryzae]|uniref:Potassium-transporting ATPase KdpC subunit n=1 Tax=Candidatus Methylobacter oryzae TaxID=2497749 RepID=A0ABY3CA96_9GAMM|nr:potassium-transporting ATPase subunit KdpC [Candidatus Methylobacter oryzae]TRW94442.1 potassium-transporting ATPase subunit KdpC [Candidatus Methylobacter oryzae]